MNAIKSDAAVKQGKGCHLTVTETHTTFHNQFCPIGNMPFGKCITVAIQPVHGIADSRRSTHMYNPGTTLSDKFLSKKERGIVVVAKNLRDSDVIDMTVE